MHIEWKEHGLKILLAGILLFGLAFLLFGGPHFQGQRKVTEYFFNRVGKHGCCRICTTGVACGNSCVPRIVVCDKPPGCACNKRVPKDLPDKKEKKELPDRFKR